jgi:hypothetical protein
MAQRCLGGVALGNLTGAVKIVENHLGKAWVKTGQIQIAVPPSPPASGPPSPPV